MGHDFCHNQIVNQENKSFLLLRSARPDYAEVACNFQPPADQQIRQFLRYKDVFFLSGSEFCKKLIGTIIRVLVWNLHE